MGFAVVPISGSSAFLNALVASGFYYHHFTFIGFLPRNKGKQQKFLITYANNFISALVIYETSNRLLKTLVNMRAVLGNRLVAVCRELTKIHEEFVRGSVDELLAHFSDENCDLKGEVVIVVSVENAAGEFKGLAKRLQVKK